MGRINRGSNLGGITSKNCSWANCFCPISSTIIMQQATVSTESNRQNSLGEIFRQQAAYAPVAAQTSARQRIEKLLRIKNYLLNEANFKRLSEAVYADFKKPEFEVWGTDVGVVKSNIEFIIKNLRYWMQDKGAESPVALWGTRAYTRYEPLGVCLIISPWNYPVNLAFTAVAYGIAAGNCIVLKPSELAPQTAAFMAEMVRQLFSPQEFVVVEGDAETSKALLELPFNHIHFTGSPAVGKYVMAAAAKHLATVTLELGGKSPALVDATADLEVQVEKIVWGKHMNFGQTCIAPDYAIVHESLKDQFVEAYQKFAKRMFDPQGKGMQQSPDLARIINERHLVRIKALVDDAASKGARIIMGGGVDLADCYIEPTLLVDVDENMDIMHEEIFGPVLPVVTFKTREEAVQIIKRRPKPLSFYISSRSNDNIRYYIENSSAGTTCVNDYMLNFSNLNLPFGGVNNSGVGKTQGIHGFISFSNERSIIRRFALMKAIALIYPPFSNTKKRILRFLYELI